jgi:hypothetical protein
MMAFSMIRGGYQEKAAYNFKAQAAEHEAEMMRRQAEFERGQAEFERGQAEFERGQADVSRIEAAQERQKGAIAVQEHEKKSRALLGEFAAKTAARGVAMTGSPLEYLASTAEDLAFERQTIKYGADISAWKKAAEMMRRQNEGTIHLNRGTIHLNRAKLMEAEAPVMQWNAQLYRKQGKEAVTSGWIKGLGTLGMASYNIYGKPAISAGAGTGGGMDTSWGVGGDHRF